MLLLPCCDTIHNDKNTEYQATLPFGPGPGWNPPRLRPVLRWVPWAVCFGVARA